MQVKQRARLDLGSDEGVLRRRASELPRGGLGWCCASSCGRVGELGNDRGRQPDRQLSQVVVDHSGSGHGPPSIAALTTAEKTRQFARSLPRARRPFAVSS